MEPSTPRKGEPTLVEAPPKRVIPGSVFNPAGRKPVSGAIHSSVGPEPDLRSCSPVEADAEQGSSAIVDTQAVHDLGTNPSPAELTCLELLEQELDTHGELLDLERFLPLLHKEPLPAPIIFDVELDPEEAELLKNPEWMYRGALSVLFRSLVFPTLLARRRVSRDLSYMLSMRYFRQVGPTGLAFLQNNSLGLIPIQKPANGKRHHGLEQARSRILGHDPLLDRFIRMAMREIVRLDGLESRPPGVRNRSPLGLPQPLIDAQLDLMGWTVGPRYRAALLHGMAQEGILTPVRGGRWYAYKAGALAPPPEQVQSYHRMRVLSLLESTICQRFMEQPGYLSFMGFPHTDAGRRRSFQLFKAALAAWLESRRIPIWQIEPGQESELVCIQVGIGLGPCGDRDGQPSPQVLDELLWTVGSGTCARLGDSAQVEYHLQRAFMDQLAREAREAKCPEEDFVHFIKEKAGLSRTVLETWPQQPSFERAGRGSHYERVLIPEAIRFIHGLLQERFPKALKVTDIKDVAVQHWPARLQDSALIEHACLLMVDRHMLAWLHEKQPYGGPYLRAFKAIGKSGAVVQNQGAINPILIGDLNKFWRMLCEPSEQIEYFSWHLTILRSELEKLGMFLRTLQYQMGAFAPQDLGNQRDDSSPNEFIRESLGVTMLRVSPPILTRDHATYT